MSTSTQSNRLVGICAVLIGLLDIILVIYAVGLPAGQRSDPGQFLLNYAQNPVPMNMVWIVLATTSILAFVLVPGANRLVRAPNQVGMLAATLLAIVGYAIAAASFLTLLARTPQLAGAYVTGDRATQAAIAAVGVPQLDPYNILVLGGVGIWFLALNILAWRGGKLHKLHSLVGVSLGAFLWLAVLAAVMQAGLLDQVAAGAGAILAPVWHIWIGIRFLRSPIV